MTEVNGTDTPELLTIRFRHIVFFRKTDRKSKVENLLIRSRKSDKPCNKLNLRRKPVLQGFWQQMLLDPLPASELKDQKRQTRGA